MDVKAKARFIKVAPRKVRLVIDLIRGKQVAEAEQILVHIPKAASIPVLKLLRSAIANAKNNFNLKTETLYIKSILANEGPSLRRYLPRAHGRADIIKKRMSHIEIVLGEKQEPISKQTKPVKQDKKRTPAKERAKKAEEVRTKKQ